MGRLPDREAWQPLEDLNFAVEQWTEDDRHIAEVLARASSAIIGRAAFKAAVEQRPGQRITLRQGAHVIARSHDDPT
jgi:hypothetical protein